MTALPLPLPAGDEQPEILSIIPADGEWWWLHLLTTPADRADIVRRTRVVAWAHVRGTDPDCRSWQMLEPMVEGDNGCASLLSDSWPLTVRQTGWLWHHGDSWCHCGADPRDTGDDDIYWCGACGGVIDQ